MNNQNYHLKMLELIQANCDETRVPKLLIHSCCAPCSSYCLELLSQYFEITVFYYNPNIYPPEEYHMRAAEQERFVQKFPSKHKISFVEGVYAVFSCPLIFFHQQLIAKAVYGIHADVLRIFPRIA